MSTTSDPILTKKFLDDEVTERTLRDANIAGFTGQPLDGGEPDSADPIYTSLVDLTQGMSLRGAVDALDLLKNSALQIKLAGVALGSNPSTFDLVKGIVATNFSLDGRTLTLNLNTRSSVQYVKNVTAFNTIVSVIGSAVSVVGGVTVEKDYVYIL
jgi:hypothetical protein